MYVIVTIANPNTIHVYGPWETRHKAMTEMMKIRADDYDMHPDRQHEPLLTVVRRVITDPEEKT